MYQISSLLKVDNLSIPSVYDIILLVGMYCDCPFCNGSKVIPGKTSFKALHPKLMEEWDYVSNLLLIDPDTVFDNSYKIAWWKCKDCSYKYPMSIARKTILIKRKQISCLKCKGFRRHISHII